MSNIYFFQTLTDQMIEDSRTVIDYNFSYRKDNKDIPISYKIEQSNITLDKDSNWDKHADDLNINVNVHIGDSKRFFGNTGIAPCDSKIKIAFEWYSAASKIRDVVEGETITYDDINKDFTISSTIPAQSIEMDVQLRTIIFLFKSAKQVSKSEKILNNDEGVMLGVLNENKLFLSGFGSLFPIHLVSNPGEKLWSITMDLDDDIEECQLFDSINLFINTAHKDYKYLDVNDSEYCERMIYEIVSCALLLVFSKLKEENLLPEREDSRECSEGSILQWIYYCKQVLGFRFDNIEEMRESIASLLEGKN